MKIIITFSLVGFSVGVCCLIVCGFSQLIYWKQIDKELNFFKRFLSHRTFLLFCAACQNERLKNFGYYCFPPSVCGIIFNLVNLYLIAVGIVLYEPMFLTCVAINFLPLIAVWIIYFIFRKYYIDTVEIIINSVDPKTVCLQEYHLVNHPQFDQIFSFRIYYFLTKRLLKNAKRIRYRRKYLLWIYQIFHLYYRVHCHAQGHKLKDVSQTEIFFSCQDHQLTFAEMLKLASNYFDHWNIDIRVIRIAPLSGIRQIWRKLISEQKSLNQNLV